MKRRVLALALALAMVLVMVPVLANENDPDEENEITVNSGNSGGNDESQVTGSTENPNTPSGDQTSGGASGTGSTGGTTTNDGTTTSDEQNNEESKNNAVVAVDKGTELENQKLNNENSLKDVYNNNNKVINETKIVGNEIIDNNIIINNNILENQLEVPTEHTHDWGSWTVITPATCTVAGTQMHTCLVSGCGKTETETVPATGHSYSVSWYWTSNYTSAEAVFICTRCGEGGRASATVSMTNDGYRYVYSAVAVFGDRVETDTRTVAYRNYCYDPCYDRTYYNICRPVWCDTSYTACGPCGHWGCGNVCTRYSSCTPCKNYTPTFRVGGYSCLATPKTGDASVIAPAMLALIGAAGAVLGKKRK